MTDLVKLAKEQRAEEFKDAVYSALNQAANIAISDVRDELGEALVNKDDLTDKKPGAGTKKATAPSAKNPGAHGHIQKDEPKRGNKKATAPTAKAPAGNFIPEGAEIDDPVMSKLVDDFQKLAMKKGITAAELKKQGDIVKKKIAARAKQLGESNNDE